MKAIAFINLNKNYILQFISIDIQEINLENKCDILEAKVHILSCKSKSLDKEILREKENNDKILATTPVLLTNENKSESNASDAVQKALNVLEEYYTFSENNNNGK